MTHRPKQHQIASLAVAAVRRQWNLQGHAVDEIREDYGEDLLVQTCFEGRMDPARIWVQVKGTAKDCTTRLPSVQIQARQILRWARTADLVVIVLWDTMKDQGWFALPQDEFDHIELSERGAKSIRLNLSRDLAFNPEAVASLAWAARIEHANRSVVYARALLAEAQEMGQPSVVHYQKGVLASLAFDLSIATGIIEPGARFTREFVNTMKDSILASDPSDLEMATHESTIMAVFATIQENCSVNGIPLALAKELCGVVHPLFFTANMMQMLESARTGRKKVESGDS
ncbi:DUF4365 domain-containing protein [Streptomyces sp. NPDC085929]|uniref:DUF4365 domain-containing protein n=1 Tax=Streptomyces sp. NPDC085929 TaxID=3365739 RepID=UPI0037D01467